jgi:membrane protein
MSVGEMDRLARTPGRVPLWSIGLTAVLVGSGFARRPISATGPTKPASAARSEAGRGRFATTPSEIPRRGWKDILLRIYEGIEEDRILANAAAVTFYALLALFPAIAALVSIYGLFADPGTIARQLDSLSAILPGGAVDVVRDQLNRLTDQGSAKLSISFVISLAISLWSANGGIKALFDALNVVYEEKEKRSFIKLNAISLAFTIGMIAFLVMALVCVIAVPVVLSHLPGAVGQVVDIARWPALLLLVALALALIYRYGPSRSEPRWRWITWGSAFAAVGWLVASALFSWYTANFGSFNKTYGSLGAVIGFMIWIWVSSIVIFIGAKLNAETEHQTARESTTGPPKPLGQRGPRMADTVGPAR